jgi:hypothetical protein
MADESKEITGLPPANAFPPGKYVELVMSQCQECPELGSWVQTIRDANGRIVKYDMWDVHHHDQTGHKKFHHFTLTRANKRIL